MRVRAWDFCKKVIRSRTIYLLVVINLCFVASEMNRFPPNEHGLADCYIPKAEELFEACYFPPPPPVWEVTGVILNCPPLFAGIFLTEVVERVFPQLCELMTAFNLVATAMCVTLQWVLVGCGVDRVLSRRRESV